MAKQISAPWGTYDYYEMYTLPKEYLPDPVLYKHAYAEQALSEAIEAKADQLFNAVGDWSQQNDIKTSGVRGALNIIGVALDKKDLHFPDYVMTSGRPNEDSSAWAKELAKQLLRNLPEYVYAVRGTNDVLERLCEKLSAVGAFQK